jgi:hypothetical protein
LRTINKDGSIIDRQELYLDSGIGCDSYLFDNDQTFTVIDCNGNWFSIDKKTGKIQNNGWQWKKELPNNYVGTFMISWGQIEYSLVKEHGLTVEEVYRFKDPS